MHPGGIIKSQTLRDDNNSQLKDRKKIKKDPPRKGKGMFTFTTTRLPVFREQWSNWRRGKSKDNRLKRENQEANFCRETRANQESPVGSNEDKEAIF